MEYYDKSGQVHGSLIGARMENMHRKMDRMYDKKVERNVDTVFGLSQEELSVLKSEAVISDGKVTPKMIPVLGAIMVTTAGVCAGGSNLFMSDVFQGVIKRIIEEL